MPKKPLLRNRRIPRSSPIVRKEAVRQALDSGETLPGPAVKERLTPCRWERGVAGGGSGEANRAVLQGRGEPGCVHSRDGRRADRLVLRLLWAVLLRPVREGTQEVRDAAGGHPRELRQRGLAISRRTWPCTLLSRVSQFQYTAGCSSRCSSIRFEEDLAREPGRSGCERSRHRS